MGIFDWLFGKSLEEVREIAKKVGEDSKVDLSFDMDQSEDVEPSPVKSINDLDLDPETKKKSETFNDLSLDPNAPNYIAAKIGNQFQTLSRGEIIKKAIYTRDKSLDFVKNIKGINIEKIVFDPKTFQTMDNNTPPYTDIDGSWYVKFETIMKCFSEKNFEAGLDELLKSNNIPKDSAKVKLNAEIIMSGAEPITIYKGNGFTIDIPPVEGSRKLIVIKK